MNTSKIPLSPSQTRFETIPLSRPFTSLMKGMNNLCFIVFIENRSGNLCERNNGPSIVSGSLMTENLREHPSENHAALKYGSTSTLSDFVQILCRVSL